MIEYINVSPYEEDREIESEETIVNAMIELAKHEERAISITISLPGDEKITYWVNDNSSVIQLLKREKKLIKTASS